MAEKEMTPTAGTPPRPRSSAHIPNPSSNLLALCSPDVVHTAHRAGTMYNGLEFWDNKHQECFYLAHLCVGA